VLGRHTVLLKGTHFGQECVPFKRGYFAEIEFDLTKEIC